MMVDGVEGIGEWVKLYQEKGEIGLPCLRVRVGRSNMSKYIFFLTRSICNLNTVYRKCDTF